MANPEHLTFIEQGTDAWNAWRERDPTVRPDLRGADLRQADLREAALREAALSGANLAGAHLSGVDLSRADLSGANLTLADLRSADLRNADLRNADLTRANLSGADLSGADLSGAILTRTNCTKVNLTGCHIYGIAVWDVELQGAEQNSLVITDHSQPTITVDHLEVAQFIYLLLHHAKIREVIDTVAKKAVLLLGRFTPERTTILNAVREQLRQRGYLPIVLDFEKPTSQDLTETVTTLAHLSRFIIVDLTDPSSEPFELATIVQQCRVPFQPILDQGLAEFAIFADLRRRYHWVLPTYRYQNLKELLSTMHTRVIEPAERKAQELVRSLKH
jgi:hypothetical protein